MFCFTRRAGQKLRIGDQILLSVQRIRGGSVRLGFDVPPDVAVDREEVAGVKKRARIAANLGYVAGHKAVDAPAAAVKPAAIRRSKAVSSARAAPRKAARKKSPNHSTRP